MSKSAQPFDFRGANGQYLVGNPGGPGNPHARNVAQLRAAVNAAVSVNMVANVIQHLYELALKSNIPAARLFLQYAVGKPAQAESPDEVEVQEWKLRRESIVSEEETMTMVHNTPLDVANCVVQMSDFAGRTEYRDEMKKHYGVNTWNADELNIAARRQGAGDRSQKKTAEQTVRNGEPVGVSPRCDAVRDEQTVTTASTAEQPVRNGESVGVSPRCDAVRDEQTVTTASTAEQTVRGGEPAGVSPRCDAVRDEQTVTTASTAEQTVRNGERVA